MALQLVAQFWLMERIEKVDGLEHAWGLQRGDINAYFATDDNTLWLDYSLLYSFKESHWLLAPTGETLDRIVDCYDHNLERNAPSRICSGATQVRREPARRLWPKAARKSSRFTRVCFREIGFPRSRTRYILCVLFL
ncbi:uncharacterized protein BT62DRAFT_937877 [Guyanagaster necrorhizus]|uniref:Uncharacterized protein n=1 Tax=Guyanagaster necrorhizus TaxID=856835 RepID=A0A9P7VHF9_9AGAR|nr:uncharacterized protein BT62DRAFT_937877 [Guyanagaster necrorhizus MCA 3950]KAG7440620.1 hypothetical protein BT62DRAFT_937877 [Guyanagaster necrorhizus MCA 3950]